MARAVKVRAITPVAPLGWYPFSLSASDVPAMSRWTQGVGPTKHWRNLAAVTAPPFRPPVFLISVMSLLINSSYFGSIGM